jgi:hypothetical protein
MVEIRQSKVALLVSGVIRAPYGNIQHDNDLQRPTMAWVTGSVAKYHSESIRKVILP